MNQNILGLAKHIPADKADNVPKEKTSSSRQNVCQKIEHDPGEKNYVLAGKTCFNRKSMFQETKLVPDVKGKRVPKDRDCKIKPAVLGFTYKE